MFDNSACVVSCSDNITLNTLINSFSMYEEYLLFSRLHTILEEFRLFGLGVEIWGTNDSLLVMNGGMNKYLDFHGKVWVSPPVKQILYPVLFTAILW